LFAEIELKLKISKSVSLFITILIVGIGHDYSLRTDFLFALENLNFMMPLKKWSRKRILHLIYKIRMHPLNRSKMGERSTHSKILISSNFPRRCSRKGK
jgi:hypothetical protein